MFVLRVLSLLRRFCPSDPAQAAMKDIIRDSTLGQLVNYISGGRFLPYADQKPSYDIPAHYLLPPSTSKPSPTDEKENPLGAELTIPVDTPHPHRASGGSVTRINTPVPQDSSSVGDHEKGDTKTEVATYDPYLVGWDGDDDPENPRYVSAHANPISLNPFLKPLVTFFFVLFRRNWSLGKRSFVTFSISLLTFSVYIGSAIYTPAIPGLMNAFGVSLTKGTLGLTLYVLGK